MPIVLLIALLVSGSVSLASQGSLPGDTLYAVKVHVNENVRGALTLSEKAKANWDVELVNRRLVEAETLAADGHLDADASAKITANFAAYAERAQKRIQALESDNHIAAAADVSSGLEASLRAHERILAQLSKEKSDVRTVVADLSTKVHGALNASETARTNAEQKFSASAESEARVAAEGKLGAATNVTEEVQRFIDKHLATLGAAATAEAEAQLQLSKETMSLGKAKLEAKAYGEAFALFQKAIRLAQQAKVLIDAKKDLDINVYLNMEEKGSAETEAEASTSTSASAKNTTESKSTSETQSSAEGKVEAKGQMDASVTGNNGSTETKAGGSVEVNVGI